MLGLGSFLIAHLFYTSAFLYYWQSQKDSFLRKQGFFLPILIYILSFNINLLFHSETSSKPGTFKNIILLGVLIFLLAGDAWLMFVESNPGIPYFFLLGLGSFLIAYLFYTIAFLYYRQSQKGYLLRRPGIFLPILIYILGFNLYLWQDIAVELRIPVLLYSIAIGGMLLAAINLFGKLSDQVFIGLLIGAILFIFSDTIIGLNKFKPGSISSVNPRFLIMFSYAIAQLIP